MDMIAAKQNTALQRADIERCVTEKVNLLKQLHAFCQGREITYFAVGLLANAADRGLDMTPEQLLAPWQIAMERTEFERFRCAASAADSAFSLQDVPQKAAAALGVPICRSAERTSDAARIYLMAYDRLPVDTTKNKAFRNEMEQRRNRWLATEDGEDAAYRTLCKCAVAYQKDESAQFVAPISCCAAPQLRRSVLFPLKRRQVCGVQIFVPADCSLWGKQGDRELENRKLQVLAALDGFCKKNAVRYFAISKLEQGCRAYGDLLPNFGRSAMEIGMLRADYELLRAKLKQENGVFRLYDDTAKGIPTGVLRITLKQFEQSGKRSDATVTVLPYDILPEAEQERKHFLAEMESLNAALAAAIKRDAAVKEAAQRTAPQVLRQLRKAAQQYAGKPTAQCHISRVQTGRSKILAYHEVYPVSRQMMRDFTISCPRNPYLWAAKEDVYYNDSANEKKTEILARLDRLCAEHGITTFAVAGLLIGLVTYADYIPNHPTDSWDLAALRSDYDTLVTVLRAKAADYGLQFKEFRDAQGLCPKTTKTVTLAQPFFPDGEIRLLPFDKMPEAYDTQYAFVRRLKEKNRLYKGMSDYLCTGKTDLTAREIARLRRKYGEQPLGKLYEEIDRQAQAYNQDAQTHLYGRMSLEKSKFISESELFPLEREKFRTMELNRPRDYSVWTPVIDAALQTQVQSIQQADLLLIDQIDAICRKLNIGYFVCGGSMLGYVRHGGFIPWDDDIDVAMLRSDYNRFISEAGALLDERFFLQTRQTDPDIPYLFSKLRLNNTEYVTAYNEHRPFHKGICLDIFPFDFIPNEPEAQEQFRESVLRLSAAHNRVVNNQLPEPIDPVKPRNLQERYDHFYGKLKRIYFFHKSLKKTQDAYLAEATKYNAQAKTLALTTVASFVPSYTYIKLEDLLPYQDVLFEGHHVKVPKRPDVFLTMQYGDYMQLPPKHNQVAHRLLRWSVDLKGDEQKRLSEQNAVPAGER